MTINVICFNGKRIQPCGLHSLQQAQRHALHRVTSNLSNRIAEHRHGAISGFTQKYGVKILVWFENFNNMEEAIRREKQLKEWKRSWKIELIERSNPDWHDLFEETCESAEEFLRPA